MENRYPLFAARRILRKEHLWDIRDYSYMGWQLHYADYSDGLLNGCRIRAQEGKLIIEKGMIKFHGFIYLLQEEEYIPYEPENAWRVLKAEFMEDVSSLDYRAYQIRFFLDEKLTCEENQMEMCRFYLREGSLLRDSYKNFSDMSTEYDTINLIHADVAGVGEKTLHPAIMQEFEKALSMEDDLKERDYFFSYMILISTGKMERAAIIRYLKEKGHKGHMKGNNSWENMDIYLEMESLLRSRLQKNRREYGKKLILVE